MTIQEKIAQGKTFLGIELGSTRIKASLIDETFSQIAEGSHEWENRLENGYWTYSLDDIREGLRGCYADLKRRVHERYDVTLEKFGAVGISAMMHGYMPFDGENNLLVPFRTWRNTTTEKAAAELTELFGFNIPQRWSVAHLYQAILDNEPHIGKISYISTLAGYVHFLLTGERSVGVGEASGMFPISGGDYDREMLEKINARLPYKLEDLLPRIMTAGSAAARSPRRGRCCSTPRAI